jgi:ATP-dependent RNA helicase TDRD9
MDFLLILIRLFLNTNSPNTKVILMSATMDSERFASYFRSRSIPIPVINMREERNFDITKMFLDDVNTTMSKLITDYESPGISDTLLTLAADIVFHHVQKDNKSSILVFLPGFYEIECFERALLHKFDVMQSYQLIILHSALPPSDQKLAFVHDNKPKIILSTNIAENSVTIPMVNVVIDFCLTKYLVANKDSRLASLKLNWTSKMSCEQRAGRTGRVCDGIVYHLVPKKFYESEMPQWTEPEMTRVPLERVILKTKMLTNRSPKNFLAGALDPPDFENIRGSVLILKEIGAMQRFDDNGNFQDDDGELTYCGQILASLPCDIYIGKFIVLGYLFSVLEEAIIIGAGLNINGTIFKFQYKNRLGSYSTRLNWSNGSGSDLIAILNAYKMWREALKSEAFEQPSFRKHWYEKSNLDLKNLCEMKELVGEISHRLDECHMWQLAGENFKPILEEKEKAMMLKICVAGAWLPYFFIQEPSQEDSERAAYRQINNLNVHRTIFFKDRDQKFMQLYSDILKQSLVERGICDSFDNMIVHFDDEKRSSKIMVSFTREESMLEKQDDRGIMLIDGLIVPEVYVAVKHKVLTQGNYVLNVMDHSSLRKYARQIGFTDEPVRDISSMLNKSSASSFTLGHDEMKGIITNIVHCGKFFFQPTGPKYDTQNQLMAFKLKIAQLEPIKAELELTNGDLVVVSYNGVRQRGIVMKPSKDGPISFLLMDLGIVTKEIRLDDVHHCPKSLRMQFDVPPRCFECSLMEICPSFSLCPSGVWTEEAIDFFRTLVEDKKVEIKIFSVVDEVVSVELFEVDDGTSINDQLVEAGYAMKREEDYISRMNSEERRSSCLSFQNSTVTLSACDESIKRPKPTRLLPPRGMSNFAMNLSGPHSPLETTLTGVLAVENQHITVDACSVNSVVLNGDINEVSSRLYVAANVSINRTNGITLREMTMMPRVPGLAEILALIFCPKMILRRSADKQRYVSLQTGLGCDPSTNEALLPLHDAIFDVNVLFTESDFENIDELRHCMSSLLFTPPNENFPPLTAGQKYNFLEDIKRLISEM